jgi:cephalosporin hydroxylase
MAAEPSDFAEEVKRNIAALGSDVALADLTRDWLEASVRRRYSYNFTWLGRPIIQYPQDIVALQEIIWRTRPEVIVETGIAHGGSLILYASILELIAERGEVIGVDIDIRAHNRAAIESHPLFKRISLIEGSSTDKAIVADVARRVSGKRTMVVLDSNHTEEHVLAELAAYAPLVSRDCYLVVLDTVIEDLDDAFFADRPWKRGDNPKTAVRKFLGSTDRFLVDRSVDHKLQITVGPEGYLLCVKE